MNPSIRVVTAVAAGTGSEESDGPRTLAGRIRERIEYHRQKLDEASIALAREVGGTASQRNLGVMLLLRREQQRHESMILELESLLLWDTE